SNLLSRYGYEVTISATGEEAVEAVAGGAVFDLVLMDIDLGAGMNGPDAAAIILERCHLPLVFLSSHTERVIVEKTESITSYGYVVKNSGETVLIASINMAFRLFDAHSRLRESENRYRRMIETSKEGIWILDRNGRTTRINGELSRLLGYNEDDIIGRNVEDFLFPDDIPDHRERFSKRQSGISEIYERRFMRKDGAVLWTIVSANTITDSRGRFSGSFSMLTDITERKLVEESLRESRQTLSAFLEHIPSLVLIKDSEHRVIFSNRLFRDFFHIENFLGKTPEELFPPEEAVYVRSRDMDAFNRGYTFYEEERADKSGMKRTLVTQKFRVDIP
ncbi:MAG TPA: PAS domain S-box protein, partial [Candidatus Sabulitectum sp.]|nr:PAS domain S-box protein [Candidatus Sabulitectum sp.]